MLRIQNLNPQKYVEKYQRQNRIPKKMMIHIPIHPVPIGGVGPQPPRQHLQCDRYLNIGTCQNDKMDQGVYYYLYGGEDKD